MTKYIHIGLSRTGTRWLAELVYPYWMEKEGVAFFPKIWNENTYIQEPKDKMLFINDGFSGALYIAVDKKKVISALENTKRIFGEYKVIVVFRDLLSLSESIKAWHIKNDRDYSRMKYTVLCQSPNTIIDYLKKNNIEYLALDYPVDLDRIAGFMEINPLTLEEKGRFYGTVINKRKSKFSLWILDTLGNLSIIRRKIVKFLP